MKKYIILSLFIISSVRTSSLQASATSFIAGGASGTLIGAGIAKAIFTPSEHDSIVKKKLSISFYAASCTIGIMLSPWLAHRLAETIDDSKDAKSTARYADLISGMFAACLFKYKYSKQPFSLSEGIFWPAAVFFVLKIPGLISLSVLG